jgi:hypothetical protein
MAGFEVFMNGRFWVFTEAEAKISANTLSARLGANITFLD